MPITLINHLNSPGWTEKNAKLRQSSNGAKIYSEAITKWYWSVFEEVFKDSEEEVLLLTVTTEGTPQQFKKYKRIFLFMHECNFYKQPTIARAKRFAIMNPQARVTFIVWNEATAVQLKINNLDSMFVPMAIDLKEIKDAIDPNVAKFDRKIIWFGHLRRKKMPYFEYFKEEANRLGWTVDYISDNKFNGEGEELTRPQILRMLQYYKYGVGVGQCAHEMAALGLKVILYAYNTKCNCAYTKEQAEYYMHRNLVSQEETDVSVVNAITNIDKLVVFEPVDAKEQAEKLRKMLIQYKNKQ